ncbi:hypothetical protein [Luteolibacter sp. AS25]|uniref:hypothetical protein n=1 Tax=Luteolibacter sp. AS25 TaxID=3135776 RepID=UPI00398AE171
MKNNYYRNILGTAAVTAALSGATAIAGTEMTPAPPMEMPSEDVISGTLSLDFNSHFISYGFDVWQDGVDNSDYGFYPSAELAFALPYDFTLTTGVWVEINGKAPGAITAQETDIWVGLSKSFGAFSAGITYQEWFYGGDSEDVIDLSFGYDTFLSPSLTIHNRVGEGASGGDTGTIFVFGVSYDVEAGPVTFSFPASVAIFATDEFHGAGLDSGYGYSSVGVHATLPLTPYIGEGFGEWDFHTGVDFYFTEDDVIGNENNYPFNVNFGIGCSF